MNILEQIEDRRKLVRTRVREVAKGIVPAFFIHGPAGHAKSHMITEELDRVLSKEKWRHHNSYMSAAGLRDELKDHPSSIHFLEDMEPLLANRDAAGILRSACGSVSGGPRVITSRTAVRTTRFQFSGGIIIASNEDLTKHGIMGAVASRMRPMRWKYEDYEIKAIILDAVAKGIERNGKSLSPTEGHMIANFVIGLMDGSNQIDLRSFFDHAIPSYLHWRHEHGVDQIQDKLRRWGRDIPSQVVHWQDVVRSKLAGQAQVESREQRLQRERRIACQCYKDGSDTNERLKLWEERTNHRKQAFYDRLGEAKANGEFQRICG